MICYEGKTSTDTWHPLKLVDSIDLDTGETGKVVGDLTVEYQVCGTAGWVAYAGLAAGNWVEHDDGSYDIQIGAAEFAAEGRYQVQIQCAGCGNVNFAVEVRDLTIAEFMDGVSVSELQVAALADFFDTDSGETYAGAVAGSVVKETSDSSGGPDLEVDFETIVIT